MRKWTLLVSCVGLAGLVFAAGCNKGADQGDKGGMGGLKQPNVKPSQTASAAGGGEALFTSKCGNCHKLGNLGGGRSPDLTHAGAEHDAKWLADQIKDPKSHSQRSRMPAFAGKMSDADIQTLADYLASQK